MDEKLRSPCGGDFESQDPVARQKAMDGEDDYRMHKGRSGIRRCRSLFGYFLGEQKVTRRRNRGPKERASKSFSLLTSLSRQGILFGSTPPSNAPAHWFFSQPQFGAVKMSGAGVLVSSRIIRTTHLSTKDRSFVDKDLPFVNKDRSAMIPDRSFVNKDRSFVNKDQSAMIPDRSFVSKDRSFVDKDLPAVNKDLPTVVGNGAGLPLWGRSSRSEATKNPPGESSGRV